MSQEIERIARNEAMQVLASHEIEHTLRLLSAKKRKAPSILVLGRDGFSDNSKYLYLALAARSPGFPVHWGTFNSGLGAELRGRNLPVIDLNGDPARLVSLLLEVSCVVYCVNPAEATHHLLFRAALAGAHKLQLWHGIGLKNLDLQNTARGNMLHTGFLAQLEGGVDIDEELSPSSLYDSQWRDAFGVGQVLRAGLPRNEVLLRPAAGPELLNVPSLPDTIREGGFLLYAPTFTPGGATPAWLDPRMVALLEGVTRRLGMGLAIKPHPFDREPTTAERSRWSSSTLLLGGKTDVYPLLRFARALVTDVSSMASDFLLCDKPVLFFRSPTLEQKEYLPRYMPELPGPHVREETEEAFLAAWDSIHETAPARRRLCRLYFETDPLQACETIIRRLVDVVEAGQKN
jgi:CDP-glycerol glycerophosphotransferase